MLSRLLKCFKKNKEIKQSDDMAFDNNNKEILKFRNMELELLILKIYIDDILDKFNVSEYKTQFQQIYRIKYEMMTVYKMKYECLSHLQKRRINIKKFDKTLDSEYPTFQQKDNRIHDKDFMYNSIFRDTTGTYLHECNIIHDFAIH